MRDFFRRLAGRAAGRYRKMSIQMVISLSFTAVAVVGMLFMGGSLYLWMSGTASAMVEDTIFLEKYKPVFGTLFSDISLTSGS